MLNITEQERAFLQETAGIATDNVTDVNAILLPLAEWIDVYGFDAAYDLTPKGREAQRIYDAIYYRNVAD